MTYPFTLLLVLVGGCAVLLSGCAACTVLTPASTTQQVPGAPYSAEATRAGDIHIPFFVETT